MDISDTKYVDFLKIYFPDVAEKIDGYSKMSPQGKTPEELKKSAAEIEEKLKSYLNKPECVGLYNIYEKIPEGIRSRFNGTKVPEDVMEAAKRDETLTLQMMELHPEIQRVEDAREAVRQRFEVPTHEETPEDIVIETAMFTYATAVAEGYSPEASAELARQRQHRDGLLEKKAAILTDPKLSEEEKKAKLKDWFEKEWLVSRQKTIKAVEDDWRGNPAENKHPHQPEKYLVHLLGKLNRLAKMDSSKISDQERSNQEKLLNQKLAEMIQHIDNNGRHDKLLEYLKRRHVQAKIGHFRDETRDILATLVLQKVPEAEREQYLTHDWHKMHGTQQNMSDEQKLRTVAKDIRYNQAGAIPQNSVLSAADRLENIPSILKKQNVRSE